MWTNETMTMNFLLGGRQQNAVSIHTELDPHTTYHYHISAGPGGPTAKQQSAPSPWPITWSHITRTSPSIQTRPCLVTQKFCKNFQILRHIESLDVCMKY